ncbi:MAG: NUDIX hydrolase [Lachnospiraceae bacterium]|nr:NUDIX hydrolase [Lachnospiraceae bacterium]
MNQTEELKDNLSWREVKTEHIVKDEYIDFRKSDFMMPDGEVYGPYYTYSRRDYCIVVAVDGEGKFLCVRQFRQGIRKITTEFTAGGIERKDGKQYRTSCDDRDENGIVKISEAGEFASAEDALDAAKRELREETGYESDEWTHLITIASNATIADNYANIYLATNCRKVCGQDLDDMEFLNVVKYSKEEIDELIREGRFEQAIHVLAWYLAKEKLG